MVTLLSLRATRRPILRWLLLLPVFGACVSGEEAEPPRAVTSTLAVAQDPVATTTHGRVRGVQSEGVLVFKGIRYGADTANTRFAAPGAPAPWAGIVDAKAYGASCPQTPTGNPGGLFSSWRPDPAPPLSEDCLFLNVWTPALADGANRAVMVWLHGGGFTSGSGSSRAYEGTRLAKRGDVVVVTINHRLNLYGYLALNHYGAGFEDSAAAGVLDMIRALEWVRDNIAAFGGDPNTVTIFGESGGGAKVSTLMSTPSAQGLFRRGHRSIRCDVAFSRREKRQKCGGSVGGRPGIDRRNDRPDQVAAPRRTRNGAPADHGGKRADDRQPNPVAASVHPRCRARGVPGFP